MTTVSIIGASGYVGGELMRLLLAHPDVTVGQVTSERLAGQPVSRAHPHLRHATSLRFTSAEEVEACDVLITALPHGRTAARIDEFAARAERVIDCSADFRLASSGEGEWRGQFVYGLPEANRERLRESRFISGVGCNATAVNLALLPLARAGLLGEGSQVFAEVKAGSSEGGAGGTDASHHPVRSHAVRSFAPVGHRHTAEIEQLNPGVDVHLSVTSVELVRGALATCHVVLDDVPSERDLLRMWRGAVRDEPFLDVVHERSGAYRHPEPKLLWGTNRADLGFAVDPERRRIVALCALDNLGKGAAGSAIQSMNLALGLDETVGLHSDGLHPV